MNLKYILQEFNIIGGAGKPSFTQITSNIYFIKKKNNNKDITYISQIGNSIDTSTLKMGDKKTQLPGSLFLIRNKDISEIMEILTNTIQGKKKILESMNIKEVTKSQDDSSLKAKVLP